MHSVERMWVGEGSWKPYSARPSLAAPSPRPSLAANTAAFATATTPSRHRLPALPNPILPALPTPMSPASPATQEPYLRGLHLPVSRPLLRLLPRRLSTTSASSMPPTYHRRHPSTTSASSSATIGFGRKAFSAPATHTPVAIASKTLAVAELRSALDAPSVGTNPTHHNAAFYDALPLGSSINRHTEGDYLPSVMAQGTEGDYLPSFMAQGTEGDYLPSALPSPSPTTPSLGKPPPPLHPPDRQRRPVLLNSRQRVLAKLGTTDQPAPPSFGCRRPMPRANLRPLESEAQPDNSRHHTQRLADGIDDAAATKPQSASSAIAVVHAQQKLLRNHRQGRLAKSAPLSKAMQQWFNATDLMGLNTPLLDDKMSSQLDKLDAIVRDNTHLANSVFEVPSTHLAYKSCFAF